MHHVARLLRQLTNNRSDTESVYDALPSVAPDRPKTSNFGALPSFGDLAVMPLSTSAGSTRREWLHIDANGNPTYLQARIHAGKRSALGVSMPVYPPTAGPRRSTVRAAWGCCRSRSLRARFTADLHEHGFCSANAVAWGPVMSATGTVERCQMPHGSA